MTDNNRSRLRLALLALCLSALLVAGALLIGLGSAGVTKPESPAIAGLASDKPDELIKSSIVRAKFCELIGKDAYYPDTSELFLAGLFTHIDAMLDREMEKIMDDLPLSEDIKFALIKGEGDIADFLQLVSSYETGDWKRCSLLMNKIGIAEDKLPQYYIEAIGWADAFSKL